MKADVFSVLDLRCIDLHSDNIKFSGCFEKNNTKKDLWSIKRGRNLEKGIHLWTASKVTGTWYNDCYKILKNKMVEYIMRINIREITERLLFSKVRGRSRLKDQNYDGSITQFS